MADFFTYLLYGTTDEEDELWTKFKTKCTAGKVSYRTQIFELIKTWLSA